MADNIRKIDVKPGSKQFDKMVFRLNKPVNNSNILTLAYRGHNFSQIPDTKGVYALPAYVHPDLSLFMIVTQLVKQDWVVSFAKATVKNGNQVTDLKEPMPTGEGLNILGKHSPNEANNLLSYFTTLSQSGVGEWRLITVKD